MAQVPIRIGIIGAGGIVKTKHLPGFSKIDDCKVLVVCNRRRATAEAVAKEWNIPDVVDGPEEVTKRADINAVLIGTYPNLHKDLAIAALKAGKHVFCQARMARNLAEAKEMLNEAKRHPKLVNQICIGPRIQPGEKFMAKLVKDGELGALRMVRANFLLGDALDPNLPMHWRFDRTLSGNQIMGVGIIYEALNRVFGPARTVTASGKVFTPVRKDKETGKPQKVEIPESVCMTGELENGAHYVFTFSGITAFPPPPTIEIYGTKAVLVYDQATHTLRMGKVGKSKELEPLAIPPKLRGEWTTEQDFANAIRKGTPVSPDFKEGMIYMQFMEAVRLSLDQGKTIKLPFK
ncbi:MAG: Gfo/Idh/MocA family oxidoreductase [Candidatus Lambdaproteobacteria bacterium]|nr:Gfo/Idh/MocA family oxidoreductase [Candidatus Lambdaproteobacteria bacterium]